MVCPLDTAAVQNYGGFSCFLVLLPRSLVLVRCFREANVAIFFFCGTSVGVDKHVFQMVSLVTSVTLSLDYILVQLLVNVEVIPKHKRLNTV